MIPGPRTLAGICNGTPVEDNAGRESQFHGPGPTDVTEETLLWIVLVGIVALTVFDGVRYSVRGVRLVRTEGVPRVVSLLARLGTVGRWVQMTWREPPSEPSEARRVLKETCRYTLKTDGYRIARARPTIRGWRLGLHVVVEKEGHASWRTQFVRTITDPWEWWLVRSALRPDPRPAPVATPRPGGRLDRFSPAELDRLLSVEPPSDGHPLETDGTPPTPGVRNR